MTEIKISDMHLPEIGLLSFYAGGKDYNGSFKLKSTFSLANPGEKSTFEINI